MSATVVNVVVYQGADFSANVVLLDSNGSALDVTGYSANAMMRAHFASANATTMSTSLSNGMLVVSMSANATAALESGRYVWDAKITSDGGAVTRVAEGIATVDPAVAR